MNHQVIVHKDESYVDAKAVGEASVAKTRLFVREITSHPEWSPDFCVLIDVTELETGHLTGADVRGISDVFRSLGDDLGTGCCAVVTGRQVDFGLARMWQAMTEHDFPLAIQIFRSLPEAEAWIRERKARGTPE